MGFHIPCAFTSFLTCYTCCIKRDVSFTKSSSWSWTVVELNPELRSLPGFSLSQATRFAISGHNMRTWLGEGICSVQTPKDTPVLKLMMDVGAAAQFWKRQIMEWTRKQSWVTPRTQGEANLYSYCEQGMKWGLAEVSVVLISPSGKGRAIINWIVGGKW